MSTKVFPAVLVDVPQCDIVFGVSNNIQCNTLAGKTTEINASAH